LHDLGANADTAAADQKVKKVFYSAKDRLDAMHAASLFTAKAVGRPTFWKVRGRTRSGSNFITTTK